jgi:energy-coupling factor transporter ATP-binding protein EcfA2
MQLISISYSEFLKQPNEWILSKMDLDSVNLLVGKNSAGKTRTLNVIAGFAKMLSGRLPIFTNGNYHAIFKSESETFEYEVELKNRAVIKEKFSSSKKLFLSRTLEGFGKIYSEKEKKDIEFQTPTDQLAAYARRDKVNHPYFEELYNWGMTLYHFEFSSTLGRNSIALKNENAPIFDPSLDTNQVIRAFNEGQKKFGDSFKKKIISDFNSIGYELEDLSLESPVALQVKAQGAGEPIWIWIKEKSVASKIEQLHLSNGMFRALSLVIQITYSIMAHMPSCIIIDDIGEGLDFERSSKLIDLLLNRVGTTPIQLIMASNDRFVMNRVPLEAWSVIDRKGGLCKIFNHKNSKEKFENFKFTGLSNFDFMTSDFLNTEIE